MRSALLKRTLDVVAAGAGLVATAPIMAAVGVAVAVDLGRPVLFRQVRPGKDGKPFELLKFRTMKDAIDRNGLPLPDAERLTPLGRWLRASSLDELPELWNILRGHMSLVGPRPLLDAVPRPLLARAGAPPRGPARPHRLGPGQRPQRRRLGRPPRA